MTIPQPTPPTGPYDPMFGLQEKVAALLTPIFQDARTEELFAYQIACRSLQAYEPETRADFVNAARTIAFSLASLVVIKEAFNPALELAEKKKVAIHANALNRSADQAERSMMDRRRYRRAYPTVPAPQHAEPEPNEAQLQTKVAEAVTAHATAQKAILPKPPVNTVPPSAIHYSGPTRPAMPPKRPARPVTATTPHAANTNGPN